MKQDAFHEERIFFKQEIGILIFTGFVDL